MVIIGIGPTRYPTLPGPFHKRSGAISDAYDGDYVIKASLVCWSHIRSPIYSITSRFDNIQPAKLQNY